MSPPYLVDTRYYCDPAHMRSGTAHMRSVLVWSRALHADVSRWLISDHQISGASLPVEMHSEFTQSFGLALGLMEKSSPMTLCRVRHNRPHMRQHFADAKPPMRVREDVQCQRMHRSAFYSTQLCPQ